MTTTACRARETRQPIRCSRSSGSSARPNPSIRLPLCWSMRISSRVSTHLWLSRLCFREISRKIQFSIKASNRVMMRKRMSRRSLRMRVSLRHIRGYSRNHSWMLIISTIRMPLRISYWMKPRSSSILCYSALITTRKRSFLMPAAYIKSKTYTWGIMRVRISCTQSRDLLAKGTKRMISCGLSSISTFSSFSSSKCLSRPGVKIPWWWSFWALPITAKKGKSSKS